MFNSWLSTKTIMSDNWATKNQNAKTATHFQFSQFFSSFDALSNSDQTQLQWELTHNMSENNVFSTENEYMSVNFNEFDDDESSIVNTISLISSLYSSSNELVETHEQIVIYVKFWAKDHFYDLITFNSKSVNEIINRVYMKCDRENQYRKKNSKQREQNRKRKKTESRKIECSFSIILIECENVWTVDFSQWSHNHFSSFDFISHLKQRQNDIATVKLIIEAHYKFELTISQSLALIRQNSMTRDLTIILKDIHNEREWKKLLTSKLFIQVMIMNMSENYLIFDERDDENRIIWVIWFHKKSLELLREYSEILLVNVTYKMNKFNLSMMNIVDQTAQNRIFYVSETFTRENTRSFVWLLSRILNIYILLFIEYSTTLVSDAADAIIAVITSTLSHTNHLLCLWHAKKNIQIYIRRTLRQQTFRRDDMLVSEIIIWVNRIWAQMKIKIEAFFNASMKKEFNIA